MKDISKEKLYGIAGTLLFHLAVLVLLYFIVMEQIPVQPEKSNIEMQSAIEDLAGEEFFEAKMMTDVQPQVSKSDPAPEAPAKDPLIAQNYEESVPVDTLDSKKKQENLLLPLVLKRRPRRPLRSIPSPQVKPSTKEKIPTFFHRTHAQTCPTHRSNPQDLGAGGQEFCGAELKKASA